MSYRKALVPLLLSLILLGGCSPEEALNQLLDANAQTSENNASGSSAQNPQSSSAPAKSLQQDILDRVNQERSKTGAAPLKLNAKLSAAAQKQAQNLMDTGIFSHTIDGKNVGDRATAAGYNWGRIGENIAEGQRSAADVMQSWMNSEGHRKNILNAEFQELGVGYTEDSEGSTYWVQVFGTPL